MGLFDVIFGSSDTSTKTTSAIPKYLEDASKSLLKGSFPIANQPYQTYGGPRIAGLTPDQLNAFSMTRENIGNYQPYLDQASEYMQSAGGPFNQAEFESYLSPYTEGVVDRIAQLGERNLSERLLPQVNTTFTGAGQFGSSRHADFTNRAVRDANESILGQQANALQSAYDSAMQNYQGGLDRRLTAGGAYAGLGGQAQQQGLTDAAQLEAIGRTQQGQQQGNLDVAYQDFLTQQQYPKEQANWLSGIMAGQPYTTTTKTSGGQSPGLLGQLGGLALGGAGIIGSTGGFGPTGWLSGMFKRGGPVKRRKLQSRGAAKGKRKAARTPMPMAGIGGMSNGMSMPMMA